MIDLDLTLVAYLLITLAGYLGWILYLGMRGNIHQNAPFVLTILDAVKKDLPVLFVSHPKTNEIDVYLGERSEKSSCTFDIPKMHLLFTPDSSTNIQPDRIGKLKIYHAEYLSPELLSRKNALALNNLRKVRDRYPHLRFLTPQDLHALLSRPASDWLLNCSTVLATAMQENHATETIPETPEEFVRLLTAAKQYLSADPDVALYHADELGVTYESVGTHRRILPKKTGKGLSSKASSDSASKPGDSAEYVYENAYRIPCGLQLFTWGAAFDASSSAATARHMEQYGLEIEARTRMDCKKENEEVMKKLITYLLPLGIFIVLCGVGIYFGSLYFHGSGTAAQAALSSAAGAWGP